jgi:hypothetical protein
MNTTQDSTATEEHARKMASFKAQLDREDRERREIVAEVERRLAFPGGLIDGCVESWLDGRLGRRMKDRLAGFVRVASRPIPYGKYAAFGGGHAVSPDELGAYAPPYGDGVFDGEDEYRLVDLRLPIDRGYGDPRHDGFLLRYSNETCQWSGEYYVSDGIARVSVALDCGDVDMLVDGCVMPHDAQWAEGPIDNLTTGAICFPRT